MLVCVVCSKEFVYEGPRGKNYKAKTCSKECRSKLQAERNKALRIHPLIKHQCAICNKKYENTNSNSKTCSHACQSEYLSKLYAGRKLTREWIENQNKSKTRDKILKRGTFKCDRCNSIFETNTSLRAHKSYCGRATSGPVWCDICDKPFKSRRGLKIHQNHHNSAWRKKYKRNHAIGIASREAPRSTSKQEISFRDWLQDRFGKGNVRHKFFVEGVKHEYDFYISSLNLIIEFDGDYWHGNPALFDLDARMKQQYRIDESWTEKAKANGYDITRVWASSVQSSECCEEWLRGVIDEFGS